MIAPLHVRSEEDKGLRLFSLDVDRDGLRRLEKILETAEPGQASGHVADLLGVAAVDTTRVEVFDIKDLGEFGLYDYLVKANGLPDSSLAPDKARIAALEGVVLILYSQAFGDDDVTLKPAAPITFVGAWDELPPEIQFTPLRSNAAIGQTPSASEDAPQIKLPRWLWIFTAVAGAGALALLAALVGGPK